MSNLKTKLSSSRSFVSSILFSTERYEGESVKTLQAELRKRRLPVSGNKQALIHRLGANDHQMSTDANATEKVNVEEGKNVNAGPQVPKQKMDVEQSSPGQPIKDGIESKRKVERLGAFNIEIPKPSTVLKIPKPKIPVLADVWSKVADKTDDKSGLNLDIPKLSTASLDSNSNVYHNIYNLEEELSTTKDEQLSLFKKFLPNVYPAPKYEVIKRPLNNDEKKGLLKGFTIVLGLFGLSYYSI